MQPAFDHNRLLKKIAGERLLPHGFFQEGRSRTFLYDNGWWTIMVEFQPSSFSKGTYLNIGLDFNFYPRDFLAFTYGYREKRFESAENEEQFEKLIISCCEYAIKKVETLKNKFHSVHSATKAFKKESTGSAQNNFDLGILYGLGGKIARAKRYLLKIIQEKPEHEHEIDRQNYAYQAIEWLEDNALFQENVKQLIRKTREMKKLPVAELDLHTEKGTANKSIAAFWRRVMGK
jgi:hypothetical protein